MHTQSSDQQPLAVLKPVSGTSFLVVCTAKHTVKKLSVIASLLLLGHLFNCYLIFYLHSSKNILTQFLIRQLDINEEGNVSTFFSAFILLFSAMLLFFIHSTVCKKEKNRRYWLFLGLIFVFLSLDESTGIHDNLMPYFQNEFVSLPPFLRFGWMIPYFIFVLVVGIFFIRFVLGLPRKTRTLILLSGFIYISSALGVEFLESQEFTIYGNTTRLLVFETLQEIMEMSGIILFIYALLNYVHSFQKPITLNI